MSTPSSTSAAGSSSSCETQPGDLRQLKRLLTEVRSGMHLCTRRSLRPMARTFQGDTGISRLCSASRCVIFLMCYGSLALPSSLWGIYVVSHRDGFA